MITVTVKAQGSNDAARRRARRMLGAVLTTLAVGFGSTALPADAAPEHKVGDALGSLWQVVLDTPTPQNPFAGGDPCVHMGAIVAPFTPLGAATVACTVSPGTPVLITAESSECSTLEPPPFYGANEAALRACARAADEGFTMIALTLDGVPTPLTQVETSLLALDLPADNILGVPAQPAFSVAHGWVALLHPLTPGTHHVMLRIVGTDVFGAAVDLTNATTLTVTPGLQG
ncbi:hypothetical protein [Pedococcus sp. 5OH_020]|uniref:hypothetical protein n=1 Tax=Pedococcus sp. 5OH_020 TaxID=2989814 RepID=UPI0022E9D0A7|nr:hypothetical protein [Pedococcus sp. 5OH_020]